MPAMVPMPDVSEVSGDGEGPRGRVPSSSIRCDVINGPVFFPLQEHNLSFKTNQKPRMINCHGPTVSPVVFVYEFLCSESRRTREQETPGYREPSEFPANPVQRGEEGFPLQSEQ